MYSSRVSGDTVHILLGVTKRLSEKRGVNKEKKGGELKRSACRIKNMANDLPTATTTIA